MKTRHADISASDRKNVRRGSSTAGYLLKQCKRNSKKPIICGEECLTGQNQWKEIIGRTAQSSYFFIAKKQAAIHMCSEPPESHMKLLSFAHTML